MKSLVTTVLQRAKLKPDHLAVFTSPGALTQYQVAFTHPSFDSVKHYNFYEWHGNIYVNHGASQYTRHRHPSIKSTGWITAITHQYLKKETLAKLSQALKFPDHIRISDAYRAKLRSDKVEVLSLHEDVFESFIGCTVHIASHHWPQGAIVTLIHTLLFSLYDTLEMDLSYEHLFSAKERIKLIYDSQGWKFDQLLRGGTLRVPETARTLIASVRGFKDTANKRNQLYETALGVLESQGVSLTPIVADQSIEERLRQTYQLHEWPKMDSLLTIHTTPEGITLKLHAPLNVQPTDQVLVRLSHDESSDYQKAINNLKYQWGIQLHPASPYQLENEAPDDAISLPLTVEFREWYHSLLEQTILEPNVLELVYHSSIAECRMSLTSPSYHHRYHWKQWTLRGKYLMHWLMTRFIRTYYYQNLNERELTNIFQYMETQFLDVQIAENIGLPQWILTRDPYHDLKHIRHAWYAMMMVIYDAITTQSCEAVAVEVLQAWIIPPLKVIAPSSFTVMNRNINWFLGQKYREYRTTFKDQLVSEELPSGQIRMTLYQPDDTEKILVQMEGPQLTRLRLKVLEEAALKLGLS